VRDGKLKKLVLCIIIISTLCFENQTLAAFNKAGRTSLQFLKIGIGARSAALGEACVANLHDINSVFWNPAALTQIKGIEVSFNYARWIGDLNIMAAAVGYNIDGIGAFAINYTGLDYGEIDEALVQSATGSVDTRTGQTFGGGDLALGISFARKFLDNLSIGINVKYLREELFEYSSSMWAFDVGSYYDTGWKGIRLAMNAQNFASQARFLETREEFEQSYDIPLLFRIGWSIDLLGEKNLFLGGNPESHKLTLNMDALHSNDFAERLHIGIEYWLFNIFAIRSGYRFNYEEGNFGIGGGINYSLGSMQMKIDYAYVDYDFLDATHRFSIIISY
jgi:hypothetical protein